MQIDRLMVRAVDIGLAASIIFVPLVMGGRLALGQVVLVVLAFSTACFWCLRQCLAERPFWFRSGVDFLFLAALAFVAFQLLPLPPYLLRTISPRIYESLPLWSPYNSSSATIGIWNTLSLTPAAGRECFTLITAFMLLFLTAVQRIQTIADVERILRVIAVATIGMAVFALIQYFVGNGKYFWFYQHPFFNPEDGAAGSFTNSNHFAQFIALGLGPVIWWSLYSTRRESRKRSAGSALRFAPPAVVAFAGLMSLSRGGAIVIILAGLLSAIIAWRSSHAGRKGIIALSGSAMLVFALFFVHGSDMLTASFDKLATEQNMDKGGGRLALWLADSQAVADYPVLGTGLGSHREVCPVYLANYKTNHNFEYTHAESGPVQVALEGGIIGLLLMLAAVCLCAYWCISALKCDPPSRLRLCMAAVAPGLAVNIVHSLVDFVWYIPGCMVLAVVLAATACRLCHMASDHGQKTTEKAAGAARAFYPFYRVHWAISAAVLIAVGYLMVQGRIEAAHGEYHWHRFLRLDKQAESRQSCSAIKARMEELESVLKHQPDHALAHLRLAGLHLEMFNEEGGDSEPTFNVRQVRDAAVASHFQSSQELKDWLHRAFGDRVAHLQSSWVHARQSLQQCPLQADAYLYLAELSFMESPNSPDKNSYISQAIIVRPHDAAIAFEVGRELLLEGDLQKACEYWQKSFRANRTYQRRLIKLLAVHVNAPFFIDTFQPDATALDILAANYRKFGRQEDWHFALAQAADAHTRLAENAGGSKAAKNWMDAAKSYKLLNNHSERLACLRRAVSCDLFNYDAHYLLADCCYALQDYETASEHFKWCMRQRPYDSALRTLTESAINKRLRLGRRPLGE